MFCMCLCPYYINIQINNLDILFCGVPIQVYWSFFLWVAIFFILRVLFIIWIITLCQLYVCYYWMFMSPIHLLTSELSMRWNSTCFRDDTILIIEIQREQQEKKKSEKERRRKNRKRMKEEWKKEYWDKGRWEYLSWFTYSRHWKQFM